MWLNPEGLDWGHFWTLCISFANVHRSVYSAWISISCTECECYIFSKQNWITLSYRRLYSLMYPRCHRKQTYYSAEAECGGFWLWRSFNISAVSSHQKKTHQRFSYFHNREHLFQVNKCILHSFLGAYAHLVQTELRINQKRRSIYCWGLWG